LLAAGKQKAGNLFPAFIFDRESTTYKTLMKEDRTMPRIANEIIHNPDDNSVTIRVTRRNGNIYDVIVDSGVYALILGCNLHI
jgi:hypothetical protein